MDKCSGTTRILSLDGGGMRGYITLQFLKKFCERAQLDPDKLYETFDYIAGTSIGGIMAMALSKGTSLADIERFFVDEGKHVFTIRSVLDLISCDASGESNRPNEAQKAWFAEHNEPFYKANCETSNYGHVRLYNNLNNIFDTTKLSDANCNVLVTGFDNTNSKFVNLSNVEIEGMTGHNDTMLSAAKKTSAAPFYFPSVTENDIQYFDGGLYANNPSSLAFAASRVTHPRNERICLLSVGTGQTQVKFKDLKAKIKTQLGKDNVQVPLVDLINKFHELFDITAAGCSEAVHNTLTLMGRDVYDQFYYYRFNVDLPEDYKDLDLSTSAALDEWKRLTEQKFDSDVVHIDNFIQHLTL